MPYFIKKLTSGKYGVFNKDTKKITTRHETKTKAESSIRARGAAKARKK